MEGDTREILSLFERYNDCIFYILLYDVHILGNYFVNLSVKHIWREENMCMDHIASEGIMVDPRIVWE